MSTVTFEMLLSISKALIARLWAFKSSQRAVALICRGSNARDELPACEFD